ncbi:MAG: hypothetical protein PHE00_02170 [Atribacterota bacterium]|nr:hypothetical protein [Atribacterota bacterium]
MSNIIQEFIHEFHINISLLRDNSQLSANILVQKIFPASMLVTRFTS